MAGRRELGVIVLAIRKADGQMVFNPAGDTKIYAGDFLIVMGEQPKLQNLEKMLTRQRR
jgi:voltage-gated potassium channel